MFIKIEISGNIETLTGLHIGSSDAFSAIGAIDSPVIRDAATKLPMIPGSSLKGKMRSLLAKKYNSSFAKSPDKDDECILGLFGSASGKYKTGRIIFSDSIASNAKEIMTPAMTGITEVKFENSISRTTAVANPRQIERVIRGVRFPLSLIYEFYSTDEQEISIARDIIINDFRLICDGFTLLQYDYIGGSGTRGYGKIKFNDLSADLLTGQLDNDILDECNKLLGVFKE